MIQDTSISIEALNQMTPSDAQQWFSQCCAAPAWYEGMATARPFNEIESLIKTAKDIWQTCEQTDFLTAFEAHPMIGDVDSLRKKYASTKAMAGNEQQGASEADEHTLQALAETNQAYLDRHGFIFIICATGLSAQTMLDALNNRLNNDTETEIKLAAAEQIKITLLRLKKGIQAI